MDISRDVDVPDGIGVVKVDLGGALDETMMDYICENDVGIWVWMNG